MKKRMVAAILILIFMLLPIGTDVDANAASSTKTYKSADQVYAKIKKSLLAHTKVITIKMDTKTMNEIGRNTDLFEVVVAMDDKSISKDADYMGISLSSWRTGWSWSSLGYATLTFTPTYRTTLTQEQKVDEKIKSVLTSLKLTGASDYKKVKAIHDYIIKRVSYDQTYKKHSAYNALINKSSVCEGYAAAAYRMFTDAGIECRIISGWGNNSSHAWNIVKVDGYWYNIDLTWDDPITSSGKQVLRYDYFLKNDVDFSDHTRGTEFSTEKFLTAYPIAEVSYQ